MGKYGSLIEEAKKVKQDTLKASTLVIKKTRKPESQKTRKIQSIIDDPDVNLGVKVPLSLRRHWAAEAKRQGTSMTAIIIEALIEKLGTPEV